MTNTNNKSGKTERWRKYFIVCCIIYTIWIIYLGGNNFDRVHREYRRTRDLTTTEKITTVALDELLDECRKKEKQTADRLMTAERSVKEKEIDEDMSCLSWPPAVIDAKKEDIFNRFERARWKLTLFYIFFAVFFLIIPQFFAYVFVLVLVKIFSTVKIVKSDQ